MRKVIGGKIHDTEVELMDEVKASPEFHAYVAAQENFSRKIRHLAGEYTYPLEQLGKSLVEDGWIKLPADETPEALRGQSPFMGGDAVDPVIAAFMIASRCGGVFPQLE